MQGSGYGIQECTDDTDNDGGNSLDLDSDGDGCFDALEGGTSFTNSDLTSGYLTGAVDANGVPIATANGQGLGTSQDNTAVGVECVAACADNDNDGVCDDVDLDDDSDGILDVDEMEACGVFDDASFENPTSTSTGYTYDTFASDFGGSSYHKCKWYSWIFHCK